MPTTTVGLTFDAEGFGAPPGCIFDVRVFNPLAASNRTHPSAQFIEDTSKRNAESMTRESMKLSMAHLPRSFSQPLVGGALYHYSLQEAWLSVGQQERSHVLNNHAVATLPTVLQPPKISHHSHQRNKRVCPHPNPVHPPGYGRIA